MILIYYTQVDSTFEALQIQPSFISDHNPTKIIMPTKDRKILSKKL